MSFLLPSQIEVKAMPSTYNVPSHLCKVGRTWAGEGVAVSAHLAQGSFMLNRWGATLIPTSSKTEQARRDLQTPSWHQARGKTVLSRVP